MTMTGWRFWVRNESSYTRTQRVLLPLPLPDEPTLTGQALYWTNSPTGSATITDYRIAAYHTPQTTGVVGNPRFAQVLLPPMTLTGGEEREIIISTTPLSGSVSYPKIYFSGASTTGIYVGLGEVNMPAQMISGMGTTPPAAVQTWHSISEITASNPLYMSVPTGYQAVWMKLELPEPFTGGERDFTAYIE